MKKKCLLAFLSLCFFFYSCVLQVDTTYSIHLYNGNNVKITSESELKEFNVSFFDNSNTKTYLNVNIELAERNGECWYELDFAIGRGNQEYQGVNFWNRFKDASEYMGIKIEDKKGRYKPVTIYPLSACSRVQGFEPIVVKLEKK